MTLWCATDFSPRSAQAEQATLALHRVLGQPTVLAHVTRDTTDRALLIARLNQRAAALDGAEPILLQGEVASSLALQAEAEGAELLVIGAPPGPGEGKDHAVCALTQLIHVPLLVVHDAAPLIAWAAGDRPLRVLLALDDTNAGLAAMGWLGRLRAAQPCDVTVVRVVWPPGEHARLGVPPPIPLDTLHPEVERVVMRELRESVAALPNDGVTDLHVLPGLGRVDVHLTALARRLDTDLLLLGVLADAPAQRWWAGSVVDGVVRHASVNVACVPVSAAIAMPGPRLRQVLATTDFSTLADRAIAWAFALAGTKGTVHLIHVAHPNGQDVEILLEKLRERVPPWARAQVAPQIIRSDHVGIAICQAAERLGVDVICMARHGHTGLAGLLLGSVAQQVVQEARRPLLLVPPP